MAELHRCEPSCQRRGPSDRDNRRPRPPRPHSCSTDPHTLYFPESARSDASGEHTHMYRHETHARTGRSEGPGLSHGSTPRGGTPHAPPGLARPVLLRPPCRRCRDAVATAAAAAEKRARARKGGCDVRVRAHGCRGSTEFMVVRRSMIARTHRRHRPSMSASARRAHQADRECSAAVSAEPWLIRSQLRRRGLLMRELHALTITTVREEPISAVVTSILARQARRRRPGTWMSRCCRRQRR